MSGASYLFAGERCAACGCERKLGVGDDGSGAVFCPGCGDVARTVEPVPADIARHIRGVRAEHLRERRAVAV